MTTKHYPSLDAIVIFLIGFILFTIGLSQQEIIGFESRFYLFALEMWRHGPSWFPTTYSEPYPDYPGTATFLIYLVTKINGGLNKWVAVLPSACAAAMTLALTYAIGALNSRRWGLGAALFLLFTLTFLTEARTISLDQFTTAITTGCFYLIYSASMRHQKGYVWWIFPLLALGFAFRGPIGLIIPAGVIVVFYALEKDYKRLFITSLLSIFLLLSCTGLLLGLAYYSGGASFMQRVLQMEVLNRMQEVATPPWYFYFVESFGAYSISYPIALLVIAGSLPRLENKLVQRLLGWMLVILIGLSIPADKKVRYILPMAPALALICGYLFALGNGHKYFYYIRRIWIRFCSFFPAICLLAVIFIHRKYSALVFPVYPAICFFSLLQVAALFLWFQELRVLVFAALAFVGVMTLVVEPINLHLNRTHDFVVSVEDARIQENAELVFYEQGSDGWVIKYLANMTSEDSPIFVNHPEALLHFKAPAFFIATEENFQKIPGKFSMDIIMRGQIGREPVVVFSKNVFHPRGVF